MDKQNRYKGVRGNFRTISIGLSDYSQLTIATDAQDAEIAHVYLPEYKITPEIKAVAELMAGSVQMYELLEKLSLQELPGDLNKEINSVLENVTNIDKPEPKFSIEEFKIKYGLSDL